jgi:hypothetical protein
MPPEGSSCPDRRSVFPVEAASDHLMKNQEVFVGERHNDPLSQTIDVCQFAIVETINRRLHTSDQERVSNANPPELMTEYRTSQRVQIDLNVGKFGHV